MKSFKQFLFEGMVATISSLSNPTELTPTMILYHGGSGLPSLNSTTLKADDN
jgi:hypothetical protein